MGILVEKGEVIILSFPYSDWTEEKYRPALVLAIPKKDELISCQITSQNTRPGFTVNLTKEDFLYGGLEVNPSYIRPDVIFTADPEIVQGSVGKLKPEKTDEVMQILFSILYEDLKSPA
jgi:mRNA interferase MazF